ncbi:MAG: hypothetical protein N2485_08295, partial [bacterium]|nr:hypothetical protein [bacterium]
MIPFIKYIESLVVCKYSPEKIKEEILKLNVPLSKEFDEEAIYEVYRKISNLNPDYFKNPTELPDIQFLKELEIEKMVAYLLKLEIPDPISGVIGAFEIVNDLDMYRVITAMALAKITEEDIELIVNAKYNIHYEPDDVKEFLHYFFNVKDWTLSQKKEYYKYVQDKKLQQAYSLALDGDKDYLIWKLGIAPDRSFDQMLREMMADCFYNFKEKTKSDQEAARKWADLAVKITDRLDRLDRETKEKKNLFDEIVFTMNGVAIAK